MSYDVKNDDMSYWAHGLWAHQVSLRYLEKWAKYHQCLTKKPLQENLYYYYVDNNNNREDETTQKQNPIPLLGEWDNNSEDETTQKQDPIPLLGEWDN